LAIPCLSIDECMVKIQDQWAGMYGGKTLAELSYVMSFWLS
jgi:hypothetical protein